MNVCGMCRRVEPRPEKMTCTGCAEIARLQVIKMTRLDNLGKARAVLAARAAGTPRKGLGTTWRYPKVRYTQNLASSIGYEYRRFRSFPDTD